MSEPDMMQSVYFHRFRESTFLLHFEIEPLEFSRFKHPFTTDKYLSVPQWEELLAKTNDVIRETERLPNWRDGKLKGALRVESLTVGYELVDKSEAIINFDKFTYDRQWFIKIRVKRRQGSKRSSSSSGSNRVTHKKSSERSTDQENSMIPNEHLNSATIELSDNICEKRTTNVLTISDDDDDDDGTIQEYSASRNKRPKLNDVSNHSDPPSTRVTRTKDKDKHQTSISSFFNKKDSDDEHPSISTSNKWLSSASSMRPYKIPKKKDSRKEACSSTSTMKLITGDSVMPEFISTEKRQQMEEFLEKSNKEQELKNIRKAELEGYEMNHCRDLPKAEIQSMVRSMKDIIYGVYCKICNGMTKLTIDGNEIPYFLVTTLNIFTEKQNLLLLDEIQKVCDTFENRLPNEEDVMHDIIFPFVIIEMLKMAHNLTTAAAVLQIKTQEEYNSLFGRSYASL